MARERHSDNIRAKTFNSRGGKSAQLNFPRLLIFGLVVISATAWAQVDTAWVRRWTGPGSRTDLVAALAVDRGGNVYAVGYSTGEMTNQDILILKYSPTGNLSWVQRYDWRGQTDAASGVVVDANGNVYVGGYVTDSLTGADYITIKCDSAGNLQWVNRYNGPGNSSDIVTGIAMDSAGNVYVTGYSYSSSTYDDFCTIKYTSAGVQQWVARYAGAGFDRAQAITTDGSGNVYVTGYIQPGNDYLTVKYNTNGLQQWVDRYNGDGNGGDFPTAICLDRNSNCYVTGYSVGAGTADYDYLTIKYTSSGTREWVARYNGDGNDNDYAYSMIPDQNGDVYVTGYSAGWANNDIAVVKYNSLGQVLWVRRYDTGVNEYARTITLDRNGMVYVGGFSAQGSNYNLLTLSYSPDGNLRWQAGYTGPGSGINLCNSVKTDRWGNVFAGGISYGGELTGSDGVVIKYIQPDVAALRVLFPVGTIDTGQVVIPQARVANQGTAPADVKAWFGIYRPGGSRLYLDSLVVSGLGPGDSVEVVFQEWMKPHPLGAYVAVCSTYRQFDQNLNNNVARAEFQVSAGPYGWQEMVPMPSGPSGRQVKDGGALTFCEADNRIYAIKGNRSSDFYFYQPNLRNWVILPLIPSGPSGKQPGKGARLAADYQGNVYLVRGNNTREFWRYNQDSGWVQLEDIPAGTSGKAVKGGSDILFVEADNCLYLLKGYKNEFYRYRIDTQTWEQLAPAPPAGESKWDRGSFIVYDHSGSIYACRAKYNQLWRYDIGAGEWDTLRPLMGMPLVSKSGKSSKLKDGGCGDYFNGSIYALKGANTCEFWRYDISGDSWVEIDTMPSVGSTLKKKRVKAGADLIYGGDAFYALKGNKTLEFWRYSIPPGADDGGYGVQSAPAGFISSDPARVLISLPGSVTVKAPGFRNGPAAVFFYDAAGRLTWKGGCLFHSGQAEVGLGGMKPGVYFIRIQQGKAVATGKLIIFS
ncbi:MAG: SBBP repeat-containing protein [bacterium]